MVNTIQIMNVAIGKAAQLAIYFAAHEDHPLLPMMCPAYIVFQQSQELLLRSGYFSSCV